LRGSGTPVQKVITALAGDLHDPSDEQWQHLRDELGVPDMLNMAKGEECPYNSLGGSYWSYAL
jgi:hypothetical protein